MNATLSWALWYVGRGWPVLPLRPGSKIPATRHGCKDATLDPDVIERWWSRHPDHNLGVATGAVDVIDIDNWDAADRVQQLAGNDWPNGPTSLTPRGWHVIVQPTGRGTTAGIIPGLDYRGIGGYIVAPPSVVDGIAYLWSPAFPPDLAVPGCPPWFLHLWDDRDRRKNEPRPNPTPTGTSTTSTYGRKALESECGRLILAPEGTRNDELCKAAFRMGRLIAGGELDAGLVADTLGAVGERMGLTPKEIIATVKSGLRAGMNSPRSPTP